MNRIVALAFAGVVTAFYSATPVLADDVPLIWQPTKNSDTSYSVKLGLRLPTELETQAGINLGMDTTTRGAVVDTPVNFWTSVKMGNVDEPAYEMNRDLGFSFDGISQSAAFSMNYSAKRIATPSLDVERVGAYAIRFDGATQQWQGLDASQSVKLSHAQTGTAMVVSASGLDNFSVLGAGVGLEQTLGDHITLSGSVDRLSDGSDPVATVNARYSIKW